MKADSPVGKDPLEASLSLLRQLPPHNTEANLERLVKLRPELEAELRNAVDVPTKVVQGEFLACDYNSEGGLYRSPRTNKLYPLVADEEAGQEGVESASPLPERLRKLEILANRAFDSYRSQYYIGGISSVYFWPTSAPSEEGPTEGEETKPESLAFGMAILIKNAVDHEAELKEATWDSIHVIEAEEAEPKILRLQITSTVLVHLEGDFPGIDSFRLGGHLTRQQEQTIRFTTDPDVISGVGRIIEEAENRMRSSLQEIYFGKTHEIVNELRSALPEGFLRNQEGFRQDLKDRVFNMPTV